MKASADNIQSRVLVEGSADAEVLVLEEPLSFWGGFDPMTGTIIDVHHPQAGIDVKDKVLVIPASRGSAGTPASIAETLRNGSGPSAFVLGCADVNICVGVSIANRLYETHVPVVEISLEEIALLNKAEKIAVQIDGKLRFRYEG